MDRICAVCRIKVSLTECCRQTRWQACTILCRRIRKKKKKKKEKPLFIPESMIGHVTILVFIWQENVCSFEKGHSLKNYSDYLNLFLLSTRHFDCYFLLSFSSVIYTSVRKRTVVRVSFFGSTKQKWYPTDF